MNPEAKAAWLENLRSGERKQGAGVLHRKQDGEDFFCCLGVLCEVAIEAGIDLRISHYDGDNVVIAYDGYDDFPPPKVWQWAGLPNANPTTIELAQDHTTEDLPGVRASLSWLNDNGKSFSEIADIIERDF